MTIPTQPVTIKLADFGGPSTAGITVTARLSDFDYTAAGVFANTVPVTGVTDIDGQVILNLFPNALPPSGLGLRGTVVRVVAPIPNSRPIDVLAAIPNTPCNLVDYLVDQEPIGLAGSQLAASQAIAARDTAATSATNASASATAAAASQAAAATSATNAATSATAAAASEAGAAANIGAAQLADYTALRAYAGTSKVVYVTGYLVSVAPAGTAGIFTRDDSDSTSADNGGSIIVASNGKRWKRDTSNGVHVDWFGAKGDDITDDSAALAAASAVINAKGGGTLVLRPAAVYRVGGQTMQNPPLYTYFTFPPNVLYPIEFANCTKPVVLRGNGAVVRTLANAKYGTFNTDGTVKVTSPGYLGVGASTPYYYMLYAHGCKGVHVENVEFDGNLNNLSVGGYFSDTGIQIQATGMWFQNNAGPVTVDNVYTHHHGEDGYSVDGPATGATFGKECGVFTGVRSECNGRQGMSLVGGKGWTFIGCTYNWTGKANAGSDTLGLVSSNPGAGVDFEAEGGKEIRDAVFVNCEFVGNHGQGMVADSGTNVDRTIFRDCTFIGTTNYALWTNRPGFRFQHCRILGTWVDMWDGIFGGVVNAPNEAIVLEDCYHANDVTQSPTGALYSVNDLLWEGGSGFVTAYRCTFEYYHVASITGGLGNVPNPAVGNGPRFVDCNFTAKAGGFGPSGRFSGRNYFIEQGGTITLVPGVYNGTPSIAGKTNSGPSEDAWYFVTGGVVTAYPATINRANEDVNGSRSTGIDADFTITHGTDKQTQILAGTLTAARTLTLSGGRQGATFRVVRTGGGAFNWSIGGLKTLTAAGQWCLVQHNGTAFVLVAYGAL